VVQNIVNEFFSLGMAGKEARELDDFNITFHTLQVFNKKVYDLLKHPKEILSSNAGSPEISLSVDHSGCIVAGEAIEHELQEESDFLPAVTSAMKNIESYAYAFHGTTKGGIERFKSMSHLVFWVNLYVQVGGSIFKTSIKFVDLCGTESLDLTTQLNEEENF